MPMNVTWYDDEQTIILCTGEGYWTWEEFHDGSVRAVELMNTVTHRVDLIYNRTRGSGPPSGNGLPHYKVALEQMPDHAGMHVFVGSMNYIVQVTMNLFFRMYGRAMDSQMVGRFVVADSVESAIALIEKDRVTAALAAND